MDTSPCPACKSKLTVPGSLVGQTGPVVFVPNWTRTTKWGPSTPVASHACLSCGYTWISLAPRKLRDLINVHGSELVKQWIDRQERGPYHDVPDTPPAREAADLVEELDSLLLDGKGAEATRRYREITGTIWDKAIETMQEWPRLKRPAKLALLGWIVEGGQKADPSANNHPMADRWIDDLPAPPFSRNPLVDE
ncbi:MAG: hypothetical protein ACP5XB_01060 [Isosphaeraceae bacterium]